VEFYDYSFIPLSYLAWYRTSELMTLWNLEAVLSLLFSNPSINTASMFVLSRNSILFTAYYSQHIIHGILTKLSQP
jgi:hypothetical protein